MFIIFEACNSANINISKREKSLFVQSYHGYVLPIDSLQTLDELIAFLDVTYCVKDRKAWPIVYLDLETRKLISIPNRNTLKLGIEPTPCIDAAIQFDPSMILEILKDGHNTNIETEFTEVDSIPKYVKKQMLSFGDDPNYAVGALGNGIWICTKGDDKLSELNPYIYQSVIGFVEAARDYSQMAYRKSIDELSEQEFDELAHEFVFHLSFKYTDEVATIELDL